MVHYPTLLGDQCCNTVIEKRCLKVFYHGGIRVLPRVDYRFCPGGGRRRHCNIRPWVEDGASCEQAIYWARVGCTLGYPGIPWNTPEYLRITQNTL